MDNKKAKVIIVIVAVVILVIMAIIFVNKLSSKNENNNNSNVNTNSSTEQEDKVNEIKKIEGYEIFNAQVSVSRGITNFKAYIRNKTDVVQNNKEFKIQMLDINGEVLGELSVHVEKIEPNGIVPISANLMNGLQDVKDYRVIEQ